MSFASQIVRTADTTKNNPTGLLSDVKPSRIITGSGAPADNIGQAFWYYINILTGELYYKEYSEWVYTGYSFSGGGGGSLDDAINVGTGARVFARISGTNDELLEFRTITSNNGKLLFSTTADEIDIEPNLIKDDVGLPLVENIKNEQLQPLLEPTANDDETRGFQIGSFWIQALPQVELWICKDNTTGAAQWDLLAAGGGGNLSNVINVGSGIGVFSQLNGAGDIAELKSLLSTTGKITFLDSINQIDFGIDINKDDVGLSLVDNIKNEQNLTNFFPTPFNDATLGFKEGSLYIQTTPELVIWICKDPSVGAAVWEEYERHTPGYLEARFNATFNIDITLIPTFSKILIPNGSNFVVSLVDGITVDEQVGVKYFLANDSTKRYLVQYSVSCFLTPALPTNETLEFFFVNNLPGTPVIANSSNFIYVNSGNFAQMSTSFIWVPSAGIGITNAFSFFTPIASTLNITAYTLTITEI